MYGAIFGDIIGSRFEFDRGGKTKAFELFTPEDQYTDDTVMTIAVADGLLEAGEEASAEEIKEAVTKSMRRWGRKYPNAGYGGRFWEWLFTAKEPKPYGSYGNGSAMRVSAAGWLYDSMERTREVARATAEVTHNHPEGIKGAECTAAVMFLARREIPKEQIKAYVIDEFGYDLSESLEELRMRHEHVESCQDSLPKALVSFFEGDSYEDVVRNAVSLGGDTDTLAAIAGAMAEAYYGMPIMIMANGKGYLEEDMLEVLTAFDHVLGRGSNDADAPDYRDNQYIKMAVEKVLEEMTNENLLTLCNVLLRRMQDEGQVPTPMVDKNHVMDSLDPNEIRMGEDITFDEQMRLVIDTMKDGQDHLWIPLFTDEDELYKGQTANIILNLPILDVLKSCLNTSDVQGIVINPFGRSLTLPKDILKMMLDTLGDMWKEE